MRTKRNSLSPSQGITSPLAMYSGERHDTAVRAAARLRRRFPGFAPNLADTAIDESLWWWDCTRLPDHPYLPTVEWLLGQATAWLIRLEIIAPFAFPEWPNFAFRSDETVLSLQRWAGYA